MRIESPGDMATTQPPETDSEELDLYPTMELDLADDTEVSPPSSVGQSAHVELVTGGAESLSTELGDIRRRRLAAAAVFLACTYFVLFFWSFTSQVRLATLVTGMAGIRCAIAGVIAALLLSRLLLTKWQVHALEYLLFGSFTVAMAFNQYFVNSDLLRIGDVPGMLAFSKTGVLSTFVMMVIYGMFIPNDPRTTAKVVLSMALLHVLTLTLVLENPEFTKQVAQLRETEHAGTNMLFLLMGAAFAIYGAYILNGLRAELHQAKSYGQYRLVRKLGQGGMGEVYLAEHQLLKRPCALKLIRPETGSDPVALARFEREVRSTAQLSHPNAIEIFDYGHTDDGTFYYVMEYLPGMSLEDLIAKHGPLPAGRVIYLIRQACAGLFQAHALGLIHRDLKPANLFVALRGGESDVVKVLDFGLVKVVTQPDAPALTAEHRVSGTPLFMAPEQATGVKELDHRADIYALGAVAYLALTGRPPFAGDSAFSVMMAHARDPVTPPSQILSTVPADLEKVIMKCLEKRPEDRYQDVRSLSRDLGKCAAAEEWGPNRADIWWANTVQPVPLVDEE